MSNCLASEQMTTPQQIQQLSFLFIDISIKLVVLILKVLLILIHYCIFSKGKYFQFETNGKKKLVVNTLQVLSNIKLTTKFSISPYLESKCFFKTCNLFPRNLIPLSKLRYI